MIFTYVLDGFSPRARKSVEVPESVPAYERLTITCRNWLSDPETKLKIFTCPRGRVYLAWVRPRGQVRIKSLSKVEGKIYFPFFIIRLPDVLDRRLKHSYIQYYVI